jgi:hypothetical protein
MEAVTAQYPGDLANPEAVASWMAEVAKNEYGLPGILPVMTSCVELTDAWTSPGDVKNVPGYLGAVDFDSLGYFQQRPSQGWGTPEQLTDADYALRAFCRAAAKLKDWEWNENTTDAAVLGRWCQEVQRSGVPDAYRDKGYPMAIKLLQASQVVPEPDGRWAATPQRKVGADKDGWIRDLTTNAYIYTNANVTYRADGEGWLYAPSSEPSRHLPPPAATAATADTAAATAATAATADTAATRAATWDWWTRDGGPYREPFELGDGSYVDAHPTRYDDVWRPDIDAWARYLVDNYHVWCNTYFDHPPEEEWAGNYDHVSFDVWDYAGRGFDIDPAVGWEIFNLLCFDPNEPNISWIIWQAKIYHAGNGWAGWDWGWNKHTWHMDHIHVTYH